MRALPRTRPHLAQLLLVGVVVAAIVAAAPGLGTAQAADPRIEEAARKTSEVQARLDELLQKLVALESEIDAHQSELSALEQQADTHAEEARDAGKILALRVRESYIRGNTDPTLALLASDSIAEAREQARLLAVLANRSQGEIEAAVAARQRTVAAAEEIAHVTDEIRARRAEVDGVKAEVDVLLAEAQSAEQSVREVVAAEIAERQRREREEAARRAAEQAARDQAERERVERERASRSHTSAGSQPAVSSAEQPAPQPAAAPAAAPQAAPPPAPAPVAGGVSCPIGSPRNYSDTWGAGRSGGRSHKGTDILAPHGTAIFAYESGTITRTNSNRLGGISLYLRGDSGNVYYYTHLQGYVGGLSPGQRVSSGQHIAFNGDTGNARGIPHLHFEVMPGGGASVNPYPYVKRACG